ncbi:MAG: hypothetical protein ACI841_002410 [Planctomycetota bacterium]|jgi:hypothetical protein
MNFLRENWLWILAPIVLVLGAVAYLLVTSESDSSAPFIYNVF